MGDSAPWRANRLPVGRLHWCPRFADMELDAFGTEQAMGHVSDSVTNRTLACYGFRSRCDLCDSLLNLTRWRFHEALRQPRVHGNLPAWSLARSNRNCGWHLWLVETERPQVARAGHRYWNMDVLDPCRGGCFYITTLQSRVPTIPS